MLKVTREDGETIDHLLRRYTEGLKRLNFFSLIKSGNVKNKKVSQRQKKNSALYKIQKRQRMEYLKRIGKLEDVNVFGGSYSNRRNRARKTGTKKV